MTQIAEQPVIQQGYDWRLAGRAMYSAIMRGESEILAFGPRGSGKTLFIADMCFRFAMKYPGMTQRWGRLDKTRMSESVLKTFEEEVLPAYPGIKFQGPNREGRHGYDLPNGSCIIIHGLRDETTLKSMAADLWWANEPSELPEGIWEEIGGTSRAQRFTVCPFRVKIGDINPMPPAHWTNKRCAPVPDEIYPSVHDDGTRYAEWFPPEKYAMAMRYNLRPLGDFKTRKILFFHVENPGYWDDQRYDWKAPGIEYIRSKLATMTGSRRSRYLEGRPAAEEDVVFPEFNRKTHLCPRFMWPPDWPVWCAYDPGYRHPCAVDFVGIAPNGQPHFVDEVHGAGIDIDALGPRIQAKATKYRVVSWLADPKGANQGTQIANGKTAMQYMRDKFGLHFQPWPGKVGKIVQDHVELLRQWLVMPNPLQIFDDCPGIINNFESWTNKKTATGELPEGDDRYVDLDNDGLDGLMGIVATNPVFAQPKIGMVRQR